jgi:hypothetical protein
MKNNVRIHRKSGKSPQFEQGKIHAPECPEIPANGATLAFYAADDDAVLANVKLSADKLTAMRQAATDAGEPFDEFLINGLAKILDSMPPSQAAQAQTSVAPQAHQQEPFALSEDEVSTRRGAADELECSVKQSDALNALFFQVLSTQEDSRFSDHILAGIVDLSASTSGRLGRAAMVARSVLRGNNLADGTRPAVASQNREVAP